MNNRKVLLIGWDAADWKVIMPLIKQGKMPTLAKLMSEGVWGDFRTLDPPLSPMLWTSMATGKRADQHGILGFIEPNAENNGIRPVSNKSRKCKAIWNILNQKGKKSNVVAWWPSNPAEPINGAMVSNFYQQANVKYGKQWKMPEGTVHPERLKKELAKLRVHPAEITKAHLLPFIPNLEKMNFEKEKRAHSVAKILAHAASVHAASTYLQRNEEWDFMAVYHDAIDHFCHSCMKFHPPQMKGVPDELYENYKHVVEAGYRFHDMMLERQLELADDDTTIMLVSDHGFHSDHLRPMSLPKEPAAPAREHSPFGIVVMKGPGIKKGEKIYGASVLDVTPTLLSLYGLPIGEDMEGKPLTQAFEDPKQPEIIKSWEEVDGNDGMHDEETKEDPWAAKEAMDQLVELGYIDKPESDQAEALERTKYESQYYLARNLIDAGKIDEAIEILESIFEAKPKETRYGQRLAFCYLHKRRYTPCRKLIDKLRELNKEINEHAKKEREEAEAKEEEQKKPGEGEQDQVSKRDQFKYEFESPLFLDYIEGLLLLAVNKPRKALTYLNKVEKADPGNPDIYFNIGKTYLIRQDWAEAETAFIKALSIDESHARAHHGLAVSYLRRNMLEQAAEELLTSVELMYFFPSAHYHLGEALTRMGDYNNALNAFKVAVHMAPGMTKAHKWLADIYENKLNDMENAKKHKDFLNENIKGEIVVVSGLPRSGTSMMMQALHNGGMEVLTDEKRKADQNNPKGYYEYEMVKKLPVNKGWLGQAKGKAVKIIAQLVAQLPPKYNYKIIFMERDMEEVLTSQQIMLGKEKEAKSKTYPMGIAEAFKKQIKKLNTWIDSQPNVDILKVNYKDMIENPEEEAENINAFLGKNLDIKQMAAAVDPSLYRNQASEA